LQEIENYESNLPEIQERLFFLKNLERTFSLDLPQLIEKRDQLKTYFQQNDQDNEICRIKAQIEHLQRDLNSLFDIQSAERKKIAKHLQNSIMSILRNLGLENANFSIQFSECKPSGDGIDDINFLFSLICLNKNPICFKLFNTISSGSPLSSSTIRCSLLDNFSKANLILTTFKGQGTDLRSKCFKKVI